MYDLIKSLFRQLNRKIIDGLVAPNGHQNVDDGFYILTVKLMYFFMCLEQNSLISCNNWHCITMTLFLLIGTYSYEY